MRRVFDVNFWGTVAGSRVAVEHLRERGGALINVGSEGAEEALPLQAAYSASKHAVKGWTDALRMEIEDEGLPISITLVTPAAIDTPYTEHARSYLPDKPKHVPPVYTPDSVARAILHAARTPVRELFVGSGARVVAAMKRVAPRATDRMVRKVVIPGTHSGQQPDGRRDALYEPGGGLRERGDYPGVVRRSLYTEAVTHPALTTAMAVGAGVLMTAMLRGRSADEVREREVHPDRREYSGREYAGWSGYDASRRYDPGPGV